MARLNFEDTVWSDPRFLRFMMKTGDEIKAMGYLVMAWRVAQRHWVPNRMPIPGKEWKECQLPDTLIETGLADRVDGGIYVRGSEECFAWLLQRSEAGKRGGPAAAKARVKNKEKSVRRKSSELVETPRDTSSYSFSSSISISEEKNISKNETQSGTQVVASAPTSLPEKRSKFTPETRAKMHGFISAYADAYKKKYGGTPEGLRDKALIGRLGHWIESVSMVRATQLVEVFLQVDYKPINESYHSLWMFFRNLNRIGVALDTGVDASSMDWNKVFGAA